ncbi:pilus assembly protein PilP [Biformimicrobium ophioploci]|uniref:Type 4a pilus biogenesis lipoprotein PilP n=1 Tax=Biformimicrobium ophioploci TaxID=3036711 RepID=A0ABQ6LUX9_9GAMM|nr:pilus assembly protein PilP [Microbulbifer sp. NKW57]GMG85900.1 type 4a pilus biogenesis lipoprotein PilP [Microbulbifer sp. NKW57]
MKAGKSLSLVLVAATLLGGCAFDSGHGDLERRIGEVKRKPKGTIEPVPIFEPYSPFIYAATALRSPFSPPIPEVDNRLVGQRSGITPDMNRQREMLEGYNFDALQMVGTLERRGQLWALINDGDGGIHRVTVGNFVGKNHGRIVNTSTAQIDIMEIVPDGMGGWLERPRALTLDEKDPNK